MRTFIALSFGIGFAMLTSTSFADCGCGPLYCKDDPTIANELAKKKASLAKEGYPSALRALLDKGGQCLACIRNSPDAFTMLLVQPNGDNSTILWDQTNEDLGRKKVLSGELGSFYIFNARLSCACCGQQKPEDRSDYNAKLGLNRETAIFCRKSGSQVTCD